MCYESSKMMFDFHIKRSVCAKNDTIVNFDQISHVVLSLPVMTLNKQMLTGFYSI